MTTIECKKMHPCYIPKCGKYEHGNQLHRYDSCS